MMPKNGKISYKIVLVAGLNRLNNSNWMFPESKKSGVKNKLHIPSDFGVYFYEIARNPINIQRIFSKIWKENAECLTLRFSHILPHLLSVG